MNHDKDYYVASVAMRLHDPPNVAGVECQWCDDRAEHFCRIGQEGFWVCDHHRRRLLADVTEGDVKP